MSAPPSALGGPTERCAACGAAPLLLVWVHGHGQCARCGCNVAPCCQPDPGADAPTASDSAGRDGASCDERDVK